MIKDFTLRRLAKAEDLQKLIDKSYSKRVLFEQGLSINFQICPFYIITRYTNLKRAGTCYTRIYQGLRYGGPCYTSPIYISLSYTGYFPLVTQVPLH